MKYEEKSLKNGIICILDHEGMVNINLKKSVVKTVVSYFDSFIKSKIVSQFKIDYLKNSIVFELSFRDDNFSIEGYIGKEFYNYFNIDNCDIDTWNDVFTFVNKK